MNVSARQGWQHQIPWSRRHTVLSSMSAILILPPEAGRWATSLWEHSISSVFTQPWRTIRFHPQSFVALFLVTIHWFSSPHSNRFLVLTWDIKYPIAYTTFYVSSTRMAAVFHIANYCSFDSLFLCHCNHLFLSSFHVEPCSPYPCYISFHSSGSLICFMHLPFV